MNQDTVRYILVQFNHKLRHSDIPRFRGAMASAIESQHALLFHNHQSEGLRYAYPLIQYKCIEGKAGIVCLGEGTEAMSTFFANADFDVCIGKESVHLEVDSIKADKVEIQACDEMFDYLLCRYLPLNQDNYRIYQSIEGLAERCEFIENILVGNILSFAKGLGIRIDGEVKCKIVSLNEPRTLMFKGVKMLSFNAHFKSNISLPDWIGLGKGVSHGFGTVIKKN